MKKVSPTEFADIVRRKTDELTKGLSPEKLATVDFLDLNREAIKLAQEEIREADVLSPEELRSIIQPTLERIKRTSFVEGYAAKDTEAMGLLLSKYFGYAGDDILEATYYGLEDSNFHTEAKHVQSIIDGEIV